MTKVAVIVAGEDASCVDLLATRISESLEVLDGGGEPVRTDSQGWPWLGVRLSLCGATLIAESPWILTDEKRAEMFDAMFELISGQTLARVNRVQLLIVEDNGKGHQDIHAQRRKPSAATCGASE